jgi:predicted DsbA family dithiol-disulfide isomerase
LPARLRVDVWSDLVCPWCHIGLHRLRRVAREQGVELDVAHHAYQLDPTRQGSGPTRDYLAQRYGAANVDGLFASAERAAAGEGLQLRLADTIACNTWDGHRLAALAATRGVQDAMVARLMRAHFEERLDLGDAEVLARLAGEVGLPPAEVGPVLAGDGMGAHVEGDLDQARAMGVRGVPFFVFDGRLAFSGAQPDEAFREAFRLAAQPPAPPAAPAPPAGP